MRDKTILKKALQKAGKNGYKSELTPTGEAKIYKSFKPTFFYGILFSHDFARAFWGNKPTHWLSEYHPEPHQNWEYHLMQMVLEDNPIQYLEQFISG